MKILIATKNAGKTREFKNVLEKHFECVVLDSFKNAPDVEETGKTFEENSVLKAKLYFEWSGIPSIADDGGLEIDFLGGEPGVKSRRWPSSTDIPSVAKALADKSEGKIEREKTDQELIDITLEKLKGVPQDKRKAKLRTVVTYYDGSRVISDSQSIEGYITEGEPPPCEPGYPFRAIFWIPKFKKLFQDLTDEEHRSINHRRRAIENVANKILQEMGI